MPRAWLVKRPGANPQFSPWLGDVERIDELEL